MTGDLKGPIESFLVINLALTPALFKINENSHSDGVATELVGLN